MVSKIKIEIMSNNFSVISAKFPVLMIFWSTLCRTNSASQFLDNFPFGRSTPNIIMTFPPKTRENKISNFCTVTHFVL